MMREGSFHVCAGKMRQKRKGSAMMIEDLRETIFGTKSMCTPHSIMSQKYIKKTCVQFFYGTHKLRLEHI